MRGMTTRPLGLGPALLVLLAAGAVPGSARAAGPSPAEVVTGALGHLVFRSGGAEMTIAMELRGSGGEIRTRTLFTRTRRQDGLSRTLVRLLAPSDIAGTGFLFVEKAGGEDEQYMYLPSLKVVKRIVGNQRQSSFLGSDFTYADLEWADLEDADCGFAPEESVGEHRCLVVECAPRRKVAYGRLRLWARMKDLAPLRVHFFDRQGKLAKALFVKAFAPVGPAKGLLATELRMVDERSGHATVLRIGDVRLRDDLPASDFTPQALRPR